MDTCDFCSNPEIARHDSFAFCGADECRRLAAEGAENGRALLRIRLEKQGRIPPEFGKMEKSEKEALEKSVAHIGAAVRRPKIRRPVR